MSRLVTRYRKVNAKKALKPFSPLFFVEVEEVITDLRGGSS